MRILTVISSSALEVGLESVMPLFESHRIASQDLKQVVGLLISLGKEAKREGSNGVVAP